MAQNIKEKYINPYTDFGFKNRDINNAINTAKKEAKEEGRMEGRMEGLAEGKAEANMENARKMKVDGMSAELIAKYTNLSIDEIENL